MYVYYINATIDLSLIYYVLKRQITRPILCCLGSFPCLSITFVLRRDIGFFIIQVYVPSMLIVILSWVSFWINIDASPARVSLGLLTVLTTTTMSGGARESLPRVSYIKAIDVWMIMCLLFVFASLIEYAIVNVVARRQIKAKPAKEERMRHRGLANNLQLLSGEVVKNTQIIQTIYDLI